MNELSREGESTMRNASPRLEIEMKSSPRSSSPRARSQRLAHGAVHVVHHLEPLEMLQRLHAADVDVDDAELPVVEQHALDLHLDVGQRGEPRDVVAVHARVPEDVADGLQQVLAAERLGDVAGGAGAAGLLHVRELGPGREEHHRDVLGVAELELPADLVPVHARHGDVEQDEVGVLREGDLEALLSAGGREHLEAVGLEHGGDRRREIGVVVDHQYAEPLVRHLSPHGVSGATLHPWTRADSIGPFAQND